MKDKKKTDEKAKTDKKKSKKKTEKPPEEKVYSVPIKNAFRRPRARRARQAVVVLREFLESKVGLRDYTIDPKMNEVLWARGASKPPRSLKVKVVKDEEKTTVLPVE